MKKLLLSAMLVTLSFAVFAQYDEEKPFHFAVGGEVSLPMSDLKASAVYGVGVNVRASYKFTDFIEGFVQTGVHVFKGDEAYYYGDAANILHLPVMAGARINAGGFVAGAGIGYGMYAVSGSSSGGFLYSPHVGYDFGSFEAQVSYTGVSVSGGSLPYLGVRAFYKF